MSEKYRVAVIGRTGKGDYGHGIDAVWREIENAEVVAVADENPTGRAAAAQRTGAKAAYADYREMLDKEHPRIVAIGPRWIDQHHDMVLACVEQGCHIYMEKPFCRTLEEADRIVEAVERKHVKLAIAHQTRYSPMVPVVKRLIAEDKLGKVLEIRARGKEDRRGGAEDMWVLGTHMFDLMRNFAGNATACFATLTQGGRPVVKADVVEGNEGLGPLAGDAVDARYTFPEGVVGYFASRRNMASKTSRFGLQIFGSNGVLEMLSGYLPSVRYLPDSSWSPGRTGAQWVAVSSNGIGKPESLKDTGLHGGNVAAVKDLLDAIEKDRPPLGNVYEARGATEMILAAFESHRLQAPVAMPLQNRKHPLTLLDR
jgi:predicted dehydrogenase